jgi:hypothetical protein
MALKMTIEPSARLFACLVCLELAMSKPAYAYLDPGTGSFIIQMVIASVAGALFAVKTYFRQIKSFLSDLLSRKQR